MNVNQSLGQEQTMPRRSFFLLSGLFFFSGACGLTYEVAWTRMFAVVAGGTTRALTAVLVAYMAGLALGSFLAGRYVDRKAGRPVLIYGILEAGIGLFALLLPLLLPGLLPVLKIGRAVWGPNSFAFDLYRMMACALVLIFPTTLMGATFPVLVRGLLSERARFGWIAGLLYTANTLGAMTGAFVSGFFLIAALGLRATVWSAAGVNLMIFGLVAGLPSLRGRRVEAGILEPSVSAQARESRWPLVAVLLGYSLSGLAAMVYEVSWTRALALALGNSTYALSLILTAYIGGLALGGMLMTPLADRLKNSLLWAAGLEGVVGFSALAVLPLFAWVTARMFNWSLLFSSRFGVFQAVRFAAAFGLILFPTLAMGALFPLVVKMISSLRQGVGEPAGRVYAANTLGAILGALLTGPVLIRGLGVETSLLAATGLSLLIGLGWLLFSPKRRRVRLGAGGGLAAAGVAAMLLIPRWNPLLMNSGPYLYARFYESQLKQGRSILELLDDDRLLYDREGEEATVLVLEARDDHERSLRINGKVDASSKGDLPTEVLSAHIPLLLHPAPKKVMMLGLASGVTAGSVLLHPEVESLDCVEISPEVVEASHYFAETSRLDYQDPRFHLILDDARNYLALSDARYDVITIEATNPWIAGLGQLYTREFFQLLSDHLRPGGIALIFLPAYNMDAETFQMVLRSYTKVFAYTALWESVPLADYLVAGSNQPLQVDLKQWQERAAAPRLAQDLARVGVQGADLLASLVMGPEHVVQAAGLGPLHTDDRRQLEFVMPKLLPSPLGPRQRSMIEQIFSRHQPATVIVSSGDESSRARLESFDRARTLSYQAFLLSQREEPDPASLEQIIQVWGKALEFSGESRLRRFAAQQLVAPLLARAKLRLADGLDQAALADWEEAFADDPSNARSSDQLIGYYYQIGDRRQTRAWAEKALVYLPGDAFALAVLGDLAQQENNLAEAERRFRQALAASPHNLELRWNLAAALALQEKFSPAEEQLRTLVEKNPKEAKYLFALSRVLEQQGRPEAAEIYRNRAKAVSSSR